MGCRIVDLLSSEIWLLVLVESDSLLRPAEDLLDPEATLLHVEELLDRELASLADVVDLLDADSPASDLLYVFRSHV